MKDRAEFIRIQISIARESDIVGGKPWSPELEDQLTVREDKLLTLHREDWETEIHQTLRHSCEEVTFHRGFPRDIRVNGVHELVASGILQLPTNTLTGLTVRRLGDRLPELLSHPGIVRLTTLDLAYNLITIAGAENLADSPNLVNLISLNLRNNNLGSIGVEALFADSSQLKNLTTLNLAHNDIAAAGAGAIAASPHLTNLTTLDLRGNSIGPAGARALADSPNFAKLISLNLWNNIIGNDGAIALSTSPHLTNLTTLNLAHNNIGTAGAVAIGTGTLPLPAKLSALRSVGFDMLANHVEEQAALVLRQFHGY
jgi:Ran GTPase-activating protein (RanGAP) involved in mRNA processing and transport